MNYTTIAAALVACSFAASTTTALAQTEKSAAKTTPAKESSSAAAKSSDTSDAAAVVVLVPFVFAADDQLADGCWARLYDQQNYDGNMLTLTGPVDVADSGSGVIAGYELGRNFDSVAIGPKATLTVWEDEDFDDTSKTFKPGQKVPDLSEKLGYFREIESLKVSCSTT